MSADNGVLSISIFLTTAPHTLLGIVHDPCSPTMCQYDANVSSLNQSCSPATLEQDLKYNQQPADLSNMILNNQQSNVPDLDDLDVSNLVLDQTHAPQDDLSNQDHFDPGSIKDNEQTDAALAAELSATHRALNQLEQLPSDGTDLETGNPLSKYQHLIILLGEKARFGNHWHYCGLQ